MRNQETTIVLDSISSQSKAETTDTHIELSKEQLDKITGGAVVLQPQWWIMPTEGSVHDFAEVGGLMSYGHVRFHQVQT